MARTSARSIRRSLAAVVTALLVSGLAAPAFADVHDPKESGHPLRVAAYILHPFGVLLDTLIFRPAHWVVEREPWSTIFGHDDC